MLAREAKMFSETEIANGVLARTVGWWRGLIQTVPPDLARCEFEGRAPTCAAERFDVSENRLDAASGCHAASTDAMTRTGRKAETALAELYQPSRQERAAVEALLARKRETALAELYQPTRHERAVVEALLARKRETALAELYQPTRQERAAVEALVAPKREMSPARR
jgi:hypothetical protein